MDIQLAKVFLVLKYAATVGLGTIVVAFFVFMSDKDPNSRIIDHVPPVVAITTIVLSGVLVFITSTCWRWQYRLYPSPNDWNLIREKKGGCGAKMNKVQ